MTELLPPHASHLERALAAVGTPATDLPVPLRALWNPDTCPSALLPWLGETFALLGANGWELAESDEARRNLIKGAVDLHRHKGTVAAIRAVIRQLRLGECDIIENIGVLTHNAVRRYNGQMVHGSPEFLAVYRVVLRQPITNDMAVTLKTILAAVAPVRCHLASLDYQSVPIRYNAKASYHNDYNHGSVR
jgi:phage tail P2-like protein